MKYLVEFTQVAKSDLLDIATYIAQEAQNKEIGKKFVDELLETCSSLNEFPNRGAFPKDQTLKKDGYRFIIHKEYLIFYSIEEKEHKVFIQAIFNAKKDYIRVLKI